MMKNLTHLADFDDQKTWKMQRVLLPRKFLVLLLQS